MKQGEIALPIHKSSQSPEYDNNFTLLVDLMNVCSKVHSADNESPCIGCDNITACQKIIDSQVSDVSMNRPLKPIELWRTVMHFSRLWRSEFSLEMKFMDYLRKSRRPVSRREVMRKFHVSEEDLSLIAISLNTVGIVEISRFQTKAGKYAIFYTAKYKI